MYCTRCGIQIPEGSVFCSRCGHALDPNAPERPAVQQRRLSRPAYDKKIAGVCAGFARYFDVDVTFVRIIWLVLIFWPVPIGLIAYIVAWIVMPRDPLEIAAPVTQVSRPVA